MNKLLISALSASLIATMGFCEDINYEVGLGANYGGIIGVTANKKIQENVELFAGLGLVGAVAGARYYINENIRLNANYGVHGFMVVEDSSDDDAKLLHGINLGADYMWNNGVSLGLVYRATSNEDDVIDEWRDKGYTVEKKGWSGDIGLSLGYRF